MRVMLSSIPGSHKALLANPPGGPTARDKNCVQPEVDVDRLDIVDISGHEPDALVWYRVIRQLRSNLLATYDDGLQ